MRFDPPLTTGRFLRRYKRFFTDVELPGGEVITAHCPNTGRLTGLLREGQDVLLEHVDKPTRKLKWTFVMVKGERGFVGVDTAKAGPLVHEAIESGAIEELAGYERIIPEVKYGKDGRSRIDLLLSRGGTRVSGAKGRPVHDGDERVYVEVKNTTLLRKDGGRRLGAFPDAVTERGRKHLEDLMEVVAQGHRAAMVYSLQRSDCEGFVPADDVDPAYGETLRRAAKAGVEVYAIAAKRVSKTGLRLTTRLPIEL